MPEEERETWKDNYLWTEIEPVHLVSRADRFEFFGFSNVVHNHFWTDFVRLLRAYTNQNCSYEWVHYAHGSFVEEKGLRIYKYLLDRDETDLLIYCDTVKTISEVKKRFSHIDEEPLYEMLTSLKAAGLLYYSQGFNEIISTVEAGKRNVLEYT
jgi:exonuclease III